MIRFNSLTSTFQFADAIESKKWLTAVVEQEGKKAGDIQYIFCTDPYLLEVNQTYLDHDTLTDIITFPNSENELVVSGEIYISIDRVIENADKLDIEFAQELSRVMVHGVLHLVGYQDASDSQKAEMRAKEDYYLNLHP